MIIDADNIVDLKCTQCLKPLYIEGRLQGNYVELSKDVDGKEVITDIYLTCKHDCFRKTDEAYFQRGYNPGACFELSDLAIPEFYLQYIHYMLYRLYNKECIYTEEAFKQQWKILSIVGQSVLRKETEEEQKRLKVLQSAGFF